jgi:hypothetical protein
MQQKYKRINQLKFIFIIFLIEFSSKPYQEVF